MTDKGREGYLVLDTGEVFPGRLWGGASPVEGEVAVCTAMTGYVESLTDPSYRGQILVQTFPLMGNYGVDPGEMESPRIQASGMVVAGVSHGEGAREGCDGLAHWLEEQGVAGLSGVDTRHLIRCLRGNGVRWGRISTDREPLVVTEEARRSVCSLEEVSTPTAVVHGEGRVRIGLLDCGTKRSLIRELVQRGASVVQVPYRENPDTLEVHGWVVSNGPGDPRNCPEVIRSVRKILRKGVPVFGVCLGHQIMALAVGARVDTLPFGHRGHNQPVRDLLSGRAYITSQNHGYAVESPSIPPDWMPWFENLNDGSNEGIRHRLMPLGSVQFHPEAHGGPQDTGHLLDVFLTQVREAMEGSRRE